ncbi:MAG: hypothetical protein PHD70_14360 [Anaerostipes sp.]|nr:hypothetical protein [Anaerostipes sp.]MDD4371121.1 hypothetical protein [Anaerostipes sp.]
MGFQYLDNESIEKFNCRLWNLMRKKKIEKAKDLAYKLYNAGYDLVTKNEEDFDGEIAVNNIAKRIQVHLNSEDIQKLQSRFIMAYCDFFGCSADYLLGRTLIESNNPDTKHFCEVTGLSEKATKRMIEELPSDIKADLMGFWSDMLDSNIFYELPYEYHKMCYELGQYYTAHNRIDEINKASREMSDSEVFVSTWRTMMEDNYLKEAEPHAGAYYLHMNNILNNMTEYLELFAKKYIETNQREIDGYFFEKLHEKMEKVRWSFSEQIDEK